MAEPMKPQTIAAKRFATTRLREGYDAEQVDEFLDRVHTDYLLLHDMLAEARAKLATRASSAVTQPIPAVQEPTGAAARVLELAEAEGERIKAQAAAEARSEANMLKAEAMAKAEEIEGKAQAVARDLTADAEAKKAELTRDVNDLTVTRDAITRDLRSALAVFKEEV